VATLSSASPSAGGTVTFRVYAGGACSGTAAFTDPGEAVVGWVAHSTPFTPANAGSYEWQATYSGDTYDAGRSRACA
jgi:hypothetical protein